jgi:hypothetical protein
MLYMVVERFKNNKADEVYRRYAEKGRMMPPGLTYVDSWVEQNLERCFQLMECEDPSLFQLWTEKWEDLVEFEITPVLQSKEVVSGSEPD